MDTKRIGRGAIIEAVRATVEPRADVRSLFEGGSAAFGRVDQWSDVDLVADVADGADEVVFDAVEAALSALSPIEVRWIIDLPAWHGMAQRFYRLRDAGEHLVVDLCLRPLSLPGHFSEVELHGQPRILFDKGGHVVATHVDREALRAKLRKRIEVLRARAAITAPMPAKELARGRAVDALHFYNSLLLAPLVEALRIRHGEPARHAFGMRYLDFDLPGEVVARLRELCFVRDEADLADKQRRARAWLEDELDRLAADQNWK